MALITWDHKLTLNVAEIDGQHQTLVGLINDLDAAMYQGRGKEAISGILDGLVAYTQFHFGAEEALMERHGFPDVATHRVEHLAFVKKIVDFRASYHRNQLGLSIGVMTFLSDWLKNHIMGTDRQYMPHVGAKDAG